MSETAVQESVTTPNTNNIQENVISSENVIQQEPESENKSTVVSSVEQSEQNTKELQDFNDSELRKYLEEYVEEYKKELESKLNQEIPEPDEEIVNEVIQDTLKRYNDLKKSYEEFSQEFKKKKAASVVTKPTPTPTTFPTTQAPSVHFDNVMKQIEQMVLGLNFSSSAYSEKSSFDSYRESLRSSSHRNTAIQERPKTFYEAYKRLQMRS